MHLIILGSGTGIPMTGRASPSILLDTGEGPVLIDIGPGTLGRLSRIGIAHSRIRHVFLTHFHPDHSSDLIHLFFATRDPSILPSRSPFTVTGPRGLGAFLVGLKAVYGKWVDIPPEILSVEELDVQKRTETEHPLFTVRFSPVRHTPHSLAYRFCLPSGKSFVYSGDTGFCNEIVELARDVDLLVLECSFPDGKEVEGHLTPSLAGRIAAIARAKKLVLIHFNPGVLSTDVAAGCRTTYQGELILGRDLLHISL